MSVRYALFCDDVRTEMNGKLLLIGCYADRMIVQRFPYNGLISGLVALDKPADGEKLRVELRLASGATLLGVEMQYQPDEAVGDMVLAALPPAPLNISSPDMLEIYVSLGEKPFERVATLAVMQGDPFSGRLQPPT